MVTPHCLQCQQQFYIYPHAASFLLLQGLRGFDHPVSHIDPHSGNVLWQGGTGVPEHREEGGLAPPLKPYNHQFHAIVGHAVPELRPEVGQRLLGGALPGNPREKVWGHIGDGDSTQEEVVQLMELPETRR